MCAVIEWNSLPYAWQAMRSDEVAAVVGRGSLVMTRGDVSCESLMGRWFQSWIWMYEVLMWSLSYDLREVVMRE